MSSTYWAEFVTRPVIITEPGCYRTRGGDAVEITEVSREYRHQYGCVGTYPNGVRDRWHKSGRLYRYSLSLNDIVERAT
jgi:hypothetical protein